MRQLVAKIPSQHRALILAVSVCLAIILLLPSEQAAASKSSNSSALEVGKRYSLDIPHNEQPVTEGVSDYTFESDVTDLPAEDNLQWSSLQVQRGDVLSNLFKKANVSQQTMLAILALGDSTKTLTRLFPGETLEFGVNEQGELAELRYAINKLKTLKVSRDLAGKFVAEELEKTVEHRQQFASAEIKSSFWSAGIEAGLSEAQIMNLAGIFGWDIDFGLDLRAGDSFSVLYQANYVDGDFVGYGTIIAAQFQNQGQVIQAVRHTDGNYYKPDGASMRQAFLRAPVSFQYVSSNFNPRRLHPVLGKVRAHNGVDYVAPVGTPIMAAGDGRVTHSGYNNLNGNYVFIKHANNIVTKYLHLSRRNVKNGDKVKQGETIGRLGATGRVTGAHLHYEFLLNGVHRNPRTVKLPQATPLQGEERDLFIASATPVLAELQTKERVLLAKIAP
ncbi:Murein DD-endopeptidase MepM and murein hydrolase activator NlpD, contain LysM domain [Arsukibacterium tuosuense]|uniref:Murein DD-endopeptidase MepM and murein hydrolase activator NlpD, contain LysM domain n=1 Tax=Arsukibacterium tuosuense TaxID=1323745 RepID=A0A285IZB0_9GAMM|nr:peptidoglycan DD-metalloendopeptidase family protein [Arsukibacterium tuosuense]SNY53389.1 Murein DD-endopeptidase MepM and murein hydrolase activator NlpD, contain LysM domain [Arsukibacterium tuosuense]